MRYNLCYKWKKDFANRREIPIFAISKTVDVAQLVRASVCGTEGRGFEPHHLPTTQKRANLPAFLEKGHIRDTLIRAIYKMEKPFEPKINRKNPKKYFIYWNHNVPPPLWHKYPRRRIRIKVYDNINRYTGEEREKIAQDTLDIWKYKLNVLKYNPFGDQLAKLAQITEQKQELIQKIEDKKSRTIAQQRNLTPLNKALDLWIESRKERTKNGNSVSTYRVTKTWLLKYFTAIGSEAIPVSQVSRLQVAEALMKAKNDRNWEGTTYNNEYGVLINFFNWLEREEYIAQNPIRGKIEKMPESKHKHRWYDKETKDRVKKALLAANEMTVYRVMQFTYFIMIRSKTELMKLKAGDIDRTLKRTRFSADLSKENVEAFRDYEPEFDQVLDEMDFDAIPKNWYIFGKKGKPSPYSCHKDLFADLWRPIRDTLGLSSDYTIYGMKHTRIVHLLMKKVDGLDISYMARHEDTKSTKEYQRDYDITLNNVYGPKDLTF